MRRRSLVAMGCSLAALFAALTSPAQVFKCPVNGVPVYQQAPCALRASGGRLMFRENGQRAPLPRSEPDGEGPPPPRVLGRTRLPRPKPVGSKSP
jgi:hypothetical protein